MGWRFHKQEKDPRNGRVVFLIECLLNQNARDMGAAESPACTKAVIEILAEAEIGLVQIPCPEIACLGFARQREEGQSIREALEAPEAYACCRSLALATAEKIQCYADQGFEVLAILGGNIQSPGCAVHTVGGSETELNPASGVFMKLLSEVLRQRGLEIPFHGVRDATPKALKKDLEWLSAIC